MKIYAISDLHLSINNPKPMDIFGGNWNDYIPKIVKNWDKVTKEDIVLIGGDISWAMKFEEVLPDIEFISQLKGHKVIIKGNHDYWWSSISKLRDVLPTNLYALQNDALRFDGAVICGSRGWALPDENGNFKTEDDERIFKRELIRIEMSLKEGLKLKKEGDKLIVLMHFPPVDTKLLDNELTQLFEKYGVDDVVFGHIHNFNHLGKTKFIKGNINYYLTSCDMVDNQLIEIK